VPEEEPLINRSQQGVKSGGVVYEVISSRSGSGGQSG
jgi:hypothetical protein